MALLRGAQKLHQLTQSTPLSLLLGGSSRHFSTESQQSPSSPKIDPFLSPPSKGAVYGKLFGINENTLKTDIIHLFEGCRLTLDDIKVEYDRMFNPLAMLLQFPSLSDFSTAFKENNRKGRWLKLDKADWQQWDVVTPYDGNYVLLHGIPRTANLDDVERFLSGCNYDSSSFDIFTRSAYPESIRMAKVRFLSQIEAMNAVIQKNGSFCLNNRILTRLIQ
ncbi:hypothetical protein RND81_01G084300 [Saponaria officinalis]|uniref:RRM domain-containing protein n=1 Tax=Saponaria officinalis TaxID=3572 RepID=A0AAW1N6D8_SAPOF